MVWGGSLGRLYPDGSLDTLLRGGGFRGIVTCLVFQDAGKILLGGVSTVPAAKTNRIDRFNADGTVDTSFNVVVGNPPSPSLNGGPRIFNLAVQPDGKILVGGSFTSLGGLAITNMGRLNSDGTLDTS